MAFALFEEARQVPAPCDPLTTRSTSGLKVRSRYNLSVRPPPVRTHGRLFSRHLPTRSPAQAAATTTVASGRFHRRDSHPPECLASIAAFQTHKWVMHLVCQKNDRAGPMLQSCPIVLHAPHDRTRSNNGSGAIPSTPGPRGNAVLSPRHTSPGHLKFKDVLGVYWLRFNVKVTRRAECIILVHWIKKTQLAL